jgi:hypothetical protein
MNSRNRFLWKKYTERMPFTSCARQIITCSVGITPTQFAFDVLSIWFIINEVLSFHTHAKKYCVLIMGHSLHVGEKMRSCKDQKGKQERFSNHSCFNSHSRIFVHSPNLLPLEFPQTCKHCGKWKYCELHIINKRSMGHIAHLSNLYPYRNIIIIMHFHFPHSTLGGSWL